MLCPSICGTAVNRQCILRIGWSTYTDITIIQVTIEHGGRDSSVGIATRYRMDGPGIDSRWGAILSAPVQTCPVAYTACCTMGTGSFLGSKAAGA
jgi:hypothetical protein